MNEFHMAESNYTIGQVAMMSGLTDRTLRNYISLGFLEGEKIDGQWRFSPEQLEAFFKHPSVRPSVLAKKNATIYDFLAEEKRENEEICLVLDVPKGRKINAMTFFCREISNSDFENIHFSYDGVGNVGRVILRGKMEDVLRLVNAYRESV